MAKKYRTMRGVSIDIGKIQTMEGSAKSVGNMQVNARGDQIDHKGNIVKKLNDNLTSQEGVYNVKQMKNVSLKQSVSALGETTNEKIEEVMETKKQTKGDKNESKSTPKSSSSD